MNREDDFSRLELNLAACRSNYRYFRAALEPSTRLLVLVKANAYGHGAVEFAAMMQREGADYLAVAYPVEGVELRRSGISLPILVLTAGTDFFPEIIDYRLEPGIPNLYTLKALCKVLEERNIRNYPIHLKMDTGMHRLGFVRSEIDQLCEFLADCPWVEVRSVYSHLAAAEDPAEDEFTLGQPWLVNAIAEECVEIIHEYRYDEPITVDDVVAAKEKIIRARGTHVDSLMERLKEPRVRRVVEPVILGKMQGAPRNDDDYRYALDLGILREDGKGSLVPGNPMYAEIMLRYLTFDEQENFKMRYGTPFWLKPDGSLDMPALMAEFQRFWRENSGADREVYGYNEATPHLVMMGYLQRVVNGGGRIAREMALGSKRLDLCVEFGKFRYAVELKMRRNFSPTESPAQLAGYLDHLGLTEGWMAIFDEDMSKSWGEKIYTRDMELDGKTLHLIGL